MTRGGWNIKSIIDLKNPPPLKIITLDCPANKLDCFFNSLYIYVFNINAVLLISFFTSRSSPGVALRARTLKFLL